MPRPVLRFQRAPQRDAELWFALSGPWAGLTLEVVEDALCPAFGFEVDDLLERRRGRSTSQLRAVVAALVHDLLSVSVTELSWRYRVDRRTAARDVYFGRELLTASEDARELVRQALPAYAHKLADPAYTPRPPRFERPAPPEPRGWHYTAPAPSQDRFGDAWWGEHAHALPRSPPPSVPQPGLLGNEDPTGPLCRTGSDTSCVADTWILPDDEKERESEG